MKIELKIGELYTSFATEILYKDCYSSSIICTMPFNSVFCIVDYVFFKRFDSWDIKVLYENKIGWLMRKNIWTIKHLKKVK